MHRDRKLPPLGALRAFEAAARLGSFTLAAAELHVTQTAVSHQVRTLEEHYSQKLFDREGRTVILTATGGSLASVLTDLLDQLDTVNCKLLCTAEAPLRITMPPALGSYWLAPRLGRFWSEYTVELNLVPSVERLDFRAHDIDIGIRCGDGSWPDLVTEKLMSYNSVPVCAPSLLEGSSKLEKIEDLASQKLIHEQSYQHWGDWLSTYEALDIEYKHGIVCQDPAMVYNLVTRGQGVALLSVEIVAEKLKSGELVAPFGERAGSEYSFYIVYRAASIENRSVQSFRDFLLTEVSADDANDQ